MKYKISSTRFRAGSRLGMCQDCSWITECNINALKEARKHCEETGHTVSVESNDVMKYEALKDESK